MSQLKTDNINESVSNSAYDGSTLHTSKYETKVPSLHKFHIFFYSLLAAFFSVAMPFFSDFANSLQSQNLYIGMMLTRGQIPYSDVFTTGGMLYFVLIALSYHLGSTIWLILIQLVSFYFAGIYFYKLVNYFSSNQKISATFTLLFFVLNIILGFGGLYPIQFAMPLLLISLWCFTKYFAGLVKDEAFIFLGIAGAVAMLFEPKTLVYWVVSSFAVIVYNYSNKHLARGFYQLLAAVFGMLIIFYIAGYFVLNLQILGPYFSQALVYQLTNLSLGNYPLIIGIVVQLMILLTSGLVIGPLYFLKKGKSDPNSMIKWVVFSSFLIYLIMAVLARDIYSYHQLFLLPFGLILTAVPIANQLQLLEKQGSHRRSRGKKGNRPVLGFFLSKVNYLPILLVLALLVFNVMTFSKELRLNKDRHTVAQSLKGQLQSGQSIYVWDSLSTIYLDAAAKSASHFASPEVNMANSTHQKMLYDELLQNKATFFILNKQKKLPEKIKIILKKNMKIDERFDLTSFAIYKKK
ncbi:DUF2079 domain-containing protein [Streptococcus hongkongensis]|nr:membrane protein [Streptococcus uberis]